MAKALPILKAFLQESIPQNGGFVISSNYDPNSTYAIYEITAYAIVKDINKNTEGLQFNTDGNRTHILVEPPTFPQKSMDPTYREEGKSIPYRFYELEILSGNKKERVMIPKEPTRLNSYFTIIDAHGENFAFLFYPTEDVYLAIRKFIADTLYNDCDVDKKLAIEAAKTALETIKKFNIWNK
ncbi:MAG: hypothetical protein SVR08_02290 [Spirochaetota bacterium]|nr:hypothetical protein [Spirochaetota bacterium]